MIVDSIMMPFRFEYAGRGELSERQQRLGRLVTQLKKLAEARPAPPLAASPLSLFPVGVHLFVFPL